ncbi:hypothetical protein Taro_055562 [Colocasia esculenta]|uniref:GDSL esterase/lipase n=1 Tax=Colocasia esculenta TaxID=4460 RepID=A0A843XRQ1_COLES|nr:hypothetical protein [Colocasia esculenta]
MEGKMGLLLLAAVCWVALFSQTASARARVPAIYVFGDSTADVGNNNYLPGDTAKANFPHNGIDYPQHKPTGRFSNGYNGIDYFAKKLGFDKSPPAYLSITSDSRTFKGVNFASGGSGILDVTGQNFSISMNTQIEHFGGVVRRLHRRLGAPAADVFLSKSLFILSTGNNDMFGLFFRFGVPNRTQAIQLTGLLASQFRAQLQALYKLGARKFAVVGSSHIGCIPLLRNLSLSGDCVEALNTLSQMFNQATKLLLHDLASTSNGMAYSFLDSYEVLSDITSQPSKYGFKELQSACCGTGRFNAQTGCLPNATYCSNRRDHLFWDRVHPTQATYRVVAGIGYHGGPKFTVPMNMGQLVGS